jgi:hypothetical protein
MVGQNSRELKTSIVKTSTMNSVPTMNAAPTIQSYGRVFNTSNEVQFFVLKRKLEYLADARGNGTSMIKLRTSTPFPVELEVA